MQVKVQLKKHYKNQKLLHTLKNGAYKESDTTLTTDVAKGSANITVVNYVGTKLPITGSSLTMICLGAGTITVVGALALDKKRKNENKD